MSKKIKKHELFEVLVPAGTTLTQFPIPDIPNLRQVNLLAIQAYYIDLVPKSVISQKVLVTKDIFKNAYLTLTNYDGKEFLKQAPMQMFQTIQGNTAETAGFPATIQETDFKNFVGQKVNYPKSYINVSSAIPVVGFDQVFLISVLYVDPAEAGKEEGTFRNRK